MVARTCHTTGLAECTCCIGTRYRMPSGGDYVFLIWAAQMCSSQVWLSSRNAGAPSNRQSPIPDIRIPQAGRTVLSWQDRTGKPRRHSLSFHIHPTDFLQFWVTFCTDILAEDSPAQRGSNRDQDLQNSKPGRLRGWFAPKSSPLLDNLAEPRSFAFHDTNVPARCCKARESLYSTRE